MYTLKPTGICDFCNEPCGSSIPGCKAYGEAPDAWGACSKCVLLIDAEQWDALLERQADGMGLHPQLGHLGAFPKEKRLWACRPTLDRFRAQQKKAGEMIFREGQNRKWLVSRVPQKERK